MTHETCLEQLIHMAAGLASSTGASEHIAGNIAVAASCVAILIGMTRWAATVLQSTRPNVAVTGLQSTD